MKPNNKNKRKEILMTINGFNNGRPSPTPLQVKRSTTSDLANNSGQGPDSPVLDIVAKRFNWGAFLLTWIWGLGNRTYITLLVFVGVILGIIPFIGWLIPLGLSIWFGIKGNTWAWQNRKWKSVEHFHEVQRKWAIAAAILYVAGLVLNVIILFMLILPAFTSTPAGV